VRRAALALGAAAVIAMVYGAYLAWPPGGWMLGGFALYVVAYHLYRGARTREPDAHQREADRVLREVAKRKR
jgi:hypothetical protein